MTKPPSDPSVHQQLGKLIGTTEALVVNQKEMRQDIKALDNKIDVLSVNDAAEKAKNRANWSFLAAAVAFGLSVVKPIIVNILQGGSHG